MVVSDVVQEKDVDVSPFRPLLQVEVVIRPVVETITSELTTTTPDFIQDEVPEITVRRDQFLVFLRVPVGIQSITEFSREEACLLVWSSPTYP